MKRKAEYKFIRRFATTLVLNYEGFDIWLVGSDNGWWECKDNLTGKSPFAKSGFTDLQELIDGINIFRKQEGE